MAHSISTGHVTLEISQNCGKKFCAPFLKSPKKHGQLMESAVYISESPVLSVLVVNLNM